MPAGYSGTPLAKKLGIREGFRIWTHGTPETYLDLLAPLPEKVRFLKNLAPELDLIHFFTPERGALLRRLPQFLPKIRRDGMIWISWPKKSSKVPSTVTEDTVREAALPIGLVDVKVCAVDETWSGLKLVIRKELR